MASVIVSSYRHSGFVTDTTTTNLDKVKHRGWTFDPEGVKYLEEAHARLRELVTECRAGDTSHYDRYPNAGLLIMAVSKLLLVI